MTDKVIMCGGCKATGVKLVWNSEAVLVPEEPRKPCPSCNGTGWALATPPSPAKVAGGKRLFGRTH